MLRFREARDAGAIPFTVQGPENGACLDTGRTIGWEIADQAEACGRRDLDRAIAVQVGGGAFAALPRCRPRSRMSDSTRSRPRVAHPSPRHGNESLSTSTNPSGTGRTMMRPWPDPKSARRRHPRRRDVRLDRRSSKRWSSRGGRPIVAPETDIVLRANELATAAGYSRQPYRLGRPGGCARRLPRARPSGSHHRRDDRRLARRSRRATRCLTPCGTWCAWHAERAWTRSELGQVVGFDVRLSSKLGCRPSPR